RRAVCPVAALTARIHYKEGVTRAGIDEVVVGEAAPAAVADELDGAGQRLGRTARRDEPAFDRLTAVAVKGHVVGVEYLQAVVHFFKAGIQRVLAGFGEGRAPEGVKVRHFVARRQVFL